MRHQHTQRWSRRAFVGGLTLAGTAGLLGLKPRPVAAEPPPETTKHTLAQIAGLCVAPQYVAEELLRGEGFTEVQYIKPEGGAEVVKALSSGEAQISMAFVAPFIMYVDTGYPIVLLGGVHVGCFELFATELVHALRDLNGKIIARISTSRSWCLPVVERTFFDSLHSGTLQLRRYLLWLALRLEVSPKSSRASFARRRSHSPPKKPH